MLRSALLLVASTALLALASISPGAAADGLPTTCVIDGMVFDECPLDEDGPPWGGGPGSVTFTKPDLGARGGGFRVAPSCLSPGRSFDAHAVIENFGGLDFRDTPVRIEFYLVHPNTVAFLPGNLLGSQTIIFPHVTSGTLGEVGVLVELSGTLPDVDDGQYQLGIDIDVDEEMLELSENNNRVVAGDVVAVGDCVDLAPALDATSVSSPVTQGETLSIAGAVRNEGEAALAGPRSFVVRYRAVPEGGDELGGTVLGEVTVALDAGSSLAPGAARITPPLSVETELPPGNYAIGADVDFGGTGDEEGAVDEMDESNNSALVGSVEVNARPPGKPDYVVTKAQITGQEKDPISAGFRFNVAIRLGNLGDNAQPGFYPEVRIVASRDQVIDSSDATLRDFPSARRIFSFGPGNALSRLVTLEVPWPAELPEGKYVIGVVVDPHDQVAEQREDNNVAIAGGVRAVIDCPHLATLEDAQAVFGEVFTRAAPLPVEPATHPGLDGELCEECFTCDLHIFTTELDVCHFDFRYKLANTDVEFFLRPMMHQACVTNLAGLVAARPSVVLEVYKDAKEFKDKLASDKAFCDNLYADSVERRYCGCSNTNYLDWAPSPHPGECVYSP
jgi:hypothetical protein